MPAYADSLLAVIDARTAAGQQIITRMGTVVERDSTGSRVTVSFDGSTGVPQPVKCFEAVIVAEGDRVAVAKVESDWVVFGNYTLRTLADVNTHFQWPSTSTTTSTVFVDMPNSPSATLTKVRDNTFLRVGVETSLRTSVSPTVVQIGVNVSSPTVAYDMIVIKFAFNVVTTHIGMAQTVTTPTADVAGLFTVTARWMIFSGTTPTLTVDSADQISINVREVYQ